MLLGAANRRDVDQELDLIRAKVQPDSPAHQMRFDLVLELLDDVRRLDDPIKTSHRRIRLAVRASGTSVTDVHGVGPMHAAMVIGYSGDVGRFANRDAYASYNGTARRAVLGWADRPPALTAGQPQGQPRSAHGRRHPDPQSRDRRAEILRAQGRRGQDQREALRSLKRHISNAVYRQLVLDAR